jgi:hypothetical protein
MANEGQSKADELEREVEDIMSQCGQLLRPQKTAWKTAVFRAWKSKRPTGRGLGLSFHFCKRRPSFKNDISFKSAPLFAFWWAQDAADSNLRSEEP